MQVKVIILDRDGVINEDSDEYIKSADEWLPIAGSIEAISRLKKAGYTVAVASNQSGLARGLFDENALQAMHKKMLDLLQQRGSSVDSIVYCPHSPNDNCQCRKPKPGMLLNIAREFNVKPSETLFVGDNYSDIQAARLSGSKPVLVKTGKGMRVLDKHGPIEGVPVYDNLAHFVREFLRSQ